MRVVDTSALYALFVEGDAHHEKAKAAFSMPESLLVPAEILAETKELLEYRHSFDIATRADAFLAQMANIEVQPSWDDPRDDILGAARAIHSSSQGKLSHCDAIVVAWCRKRGFLPLAFDKHLIAAAGS